MLCDTGSTRERHQKDERIEGKKKEEKVIGKEKDLFKRLVLYQFSKLHLR
jgi:hypothetical protein